MSFQDRHYSRDAERPAFGGQDFASRLLRWLNASFFIGRYFGISVRVHITFVLLLIFSLLREGEPLWTLQWTGMLFVSVLLHEFGHCFGCRWVGGRADQVLMWPLGGLAFCEAPRRPGAEFVTVAAGPLVNLVLAGVAYVALYVGFGPDTPVSLHPLRPMQWWPGQIAAQFITLVFTVNYALLLFNMLLIFYPFDAGRLIQIGLWTRVGYLRSMRMATAFGMAGAVVTALLAMAWNDSRLIFIALFGFIACYQQRQALMGLSEYDFGDEFAYAGTARRRKNWLTRWRESRAQQAARREAERKLAMERQVDTILEKIHQDGLESLTAAERRVLQQVTRQKRGA